MSDDFYVGYLPLPRSDKRFLLGLVSLLVVGVTVASVLISSQQNDPGEGDWDLNNPVTVTGVLRTDPYVMLSVSNQAGESVRNILLVTMGKIGGSGLQLPAAGETVTVVGYPISRDRDDAILLTVESRPVAAAEKVDRQADWFSQPLGLATLNGQIIDPKCYFGAMKPGEGKVHKACATLCIRGGIPPMFMVIDAQNRRTYYLLLDQNGDGVTGDPLDRLSPYIADPVRISGTVERMGDLLIFKIDVAKIHRL